MKTLLFFAIYLFSVECFSQSALVDDSTVFKQGKKLILRVESIAFVFDTLDVDSTGVLTETAILHKQMIAAFRKDKTELVRFKRMLRENPSTAFKRYNKL